VPGDLRRGVVLKLRRGRVVTADPLVVVVEGKERNAWADPALVGEMHEGDEVVVNVESMDLGLGSGGFDVVHVNLTRGLESPGAAGTHVMKLNYTSLQHPVLPVERPVGSVAADPPSATGMPALVIPLHGHLAPVAWAAAQAAPDLTIGFVQTVGGALSGTLSRDLATLRERGLVGDHVTAGPCFGAEHEAISTAGALDAAATTLGWDAAILGPGPGILGSATDLGHGGITAVENAHAALALGLPTLLSPRLSSTDRRDRHRPLSHHTRTALELLLAPLEIAVPEGFPDALEALEGAKGQHRLATARVDLDAYARSGLPAKTMGRELTDDPVFFAAPLAAGLRLARVAGGQTGS
jgi:hypothetical protein